MGKEARTTALETPDMFCSDEELKMNARKKNGQKGDKERLITKCMGCLRRAVTKHT